MKDGKHPQDLAQTLLAEIRSLELIAKDLLLQWPALGNSTFQESPMEQPLLRIDDKTSIQHSPHHPKSSRISAINTAEHDESS